MADYTPPGGRAVALDFKGLYTPPGGARVGLEFAPSDGPVGSDQYLFPSGWDSLALGAARMRLAQQFVGAQGWGSSNVGIGGKVWNRDQVVRHGGTDYLASGRPTVQLWRRYLTPAGLHSLAVGAATVTHGVRRVTAVGAVDLLRLGAAWVSRSPRALEPAGISPPGVMGSHVVGGSRTVAPLGTDMQAFGTRIIPEGQSLYPQGFAGEAGQPGVQNWVAYVRPQGFVTNSDELRFGRAAVWKLRQYIQQVYDPNDGLNPPGFGQWMGIENRNKEPVPVGWLSERHGYTSIFNKATAVLPAGVAPPADPPYQKAGAVTHKNRPLELPGFDSQGFSGWHVVSNNADLLRPAGADTMALGTPGLENRSRQYKDIGNMDTMAMGTPMVALAVRGIDFEPRYSIEPPAIPLPEVKLHTRYVEYVSAGDQLGAGVPSLSIHWTIIEPKWAFHPPAWIGEPALRNVTPELRTGGANHEEFGAALVRTQWRRVETQGADTAQFGAARARDRRSWVFASGLIPPVMQPGPVVTKVGGLPDPQQVVVGGVAPPAMPAPTFNIQSAKPAGLDVLRFGAAEVRANSIRVEPGIFGHYFGQPVVGLKRRVLDVDKGGIPGHEMGTYRVSPHTIYATVEAPQQAIENHERRLLHYVDHDVVYNRPLTGPGTPAITHKARRVVASGVRPPDVQNLHAIMNRRVAVYPTGMQVLRMGSVVTNGPQAIVQDNGADGLAVGTAKVARAPYTGPQQVAPQGVPAPAIAGSSIDFRNRALRMAGWHAMAMGASKPGDTPYQWQGLRVGPLVPTVPHGFDAQQFGTAWVSLRVRDVPLQGFDALEADYDPQNFHRRMRVANATTPKPAAQGLAPIGVEPPAVPGHSTRMGRHYIRPDGNAEQYRKGAP